MKFSLQKNRIIRAFFALPYFTIILFIAFFCYKRGFSQYYVKSGMISEDISKITRSIDSDPKNSEAYKFRGNLLQKNGNYQAAANDLNQAILLNPNDYVLWLQLAFTNSKLQNFEEAQNAYEKSISLAPNYFQPKQYLGYLYLRQNKPKPAYTYLSQAAAIKPSLFPEVLQLAFLTFAGNSVTIENLVQTNSPEAKKEMANFFIKNNIISEKTVEFLTNGELSDSEKNLYVNQLIASKNYQLAFSVWRSKEDVKNNLQVSDKNLILEGSFENDILIDQAGFGWQISDEPNVSIKLDGNKPFLEKTALEIIFKGKSNPAAPIVSQLVIVKPNQRYKLTFAARTEELSTGGFPIISIIDSDSGNTISQSTPLSTTNNQWQKFTVDFKTADQTKALKIRMQRQSCKENPCPIFGKLWLDGFNLLEF